MKRTIKSIGSSGNDKNDFTVNVDENNNLVICMEKKEERMRRKKTQKIPTHTEFSYSNSTKYHTAGQC